MTELEESKLILQREFADSPHTKKELLGNAACCRKIRNLIIQFILAKKDHGQCLDEIKALMLNFGVMEDDFVKEIIPFIDAFYKAKELIDRGYCNELEKKS